MNGRQFVGARSFAILHTQINIMLFQYVYCVAATPIRAPDYLLFFFISSFICCCRSKRPTANEHDWKKETLEVKSHTYTQHTKFQLIIINNKINRNSYQSGTVWIHTIIAQIDDYCVISFDSDRSNNSPIIFSFIFVFCLLFYRIFFFHNTQTFAIPNSLVLRLLSVELCRIEWFDSFRLYK